MRFSNLKFLLIFSFLFLLFGCTKTPMEKLKSDVRYMDMNNPFWMQENLAKSPLWKEAIKYCKDHNEKPNCGSVMEIYVVSNGLTEVPAYGTSGHTITIPDF